MPWPPKYIALAGAELEGGWLQEPSTGVYHHDGSVAVRAPIVGEFVSEPLLPAALVDWVRDPEVYPPFINNSCGLHVHMSFKDNNNYVRVMTEEYYIAFGTAMKKLGTDLALPASDSFWSRLSGNNQYCRKEFVPNHQWTDRNKNERRYTQLNYCYGLRGTLECRLFPMFKSRKTAGEAIKGLLQFTDDWLLKTKTRKQDQEKFVVVLSDEDEVVDEVVGVVAPPPPPTRGRQAIPDWAHTVASARTWAAMAGGAGGSSFVTMPQVEYASIEPIDYDAPDYDPDDTGR